ncbi:UPF0764 protein C16orf89 homolog isoform X2 [Mustelus asterias]
MNPALIAFATLTFVSANQPKLSDVLSALEKATSFFESTYNHLDVDGVVGFRLLQAQLGHAMTKWSLSGPEAASQFKKVDDLVRRLDFTSVKAIKAMKMNDSKYFNAFQQVLHVDFWTLKPGWMQTDTKLVYAGVSDSECFDEDISDRCMTQLLGTWEENGLPCQDTDTCSSLMMALNCADYSLSHQLLYLIVAEHKRCSNIFGARHMDSKSSLIIQHYKKIFCSNMMQRNLEIANNDFPYFQQDLFLENDKSGYLPRGEQNVFTKPKRVKRREKHLQGGCSDHMTSVAVGALGGYLRFYGTS